MNTAAINKLRQVLNAQKLDALLITKEVNVAYLTGFRGEGELLLMPNKQILLVDFRFREQAEKMAGSWQVYPRANFCPLEESLLYLAKKLKLKNLGFEACALSYEFHHQLKRALQPVRLVATKHIIESLRVIKSAQEIRLLKKAATLAVKSLAFAKRIIKPGRKEVEISQEVQHFMHKMGAENCAFEPIVASGVRSSMPHAWATDKTIKDNEAVLLDLGCRIWGYNSDLTRMVFLGKIKGEIKRIYEIVLRAQEEAIKAVRAGAKILQIDKIARQYIAREGLAAFFGHALGHGIGREVHEYPSISPENQDVLKPGMVFTVEPAVYIPGSGGVRLEDMVLVTQSGCEILTKG